MGSCLTLLQSLPQDIKWCVPATDKAKRVICFKCLGILMKFMATPTMCRRVQMSAGILRTRSATSICGCMTGDPTLPAGALINISTLDLVRARVSVPMLVAGCNDGGIMDDLTDA
jgi:hypothetical protein